VGILHCFVFFLRSGWFLYKLLHGPFSHSSKY
jgi:hypothetical protein